MLANNYCIHKEKVSLALVSVFICGSLQGTPVPCMAYLHSAYRPTNKHQIHGEQHFRITSGDEEGSSVNPSEQPIPGHSLSCRNTDGEATTQEEQGRRPAAPQLVLTSWAERKWMCNNFLSLSTKGRNVTVTSSSVFKLAPAPRLPYPSFSMATRAEKWPLV